MSTAATCIDAWRRDPGQDDDTPERMAGSYLIAMAIMDLHLIADAHRKKD